jgi:hypothetical protein
MKHDRCCSQCGGVTATSAEAHRDRVHVAREGRTVEPIVQHSSVLLTEHGEARTGDRDEVEVEGVDDVENGPGNVRGSRFELRARSRYTAEHRVLVESVGLPELQRARHPTGVRQARGTQNDVGDGSRTGDRVEAPSAPAPTGLAVGVGEGVTDLAGVARGAAPR